ncbi:UDP-4-amino-4,6-dideoxy-N-acetyl-beta-L-altrosamine transaminase [Helicobacter bizzozeronii]|uniref:UDP-4-amino-4, 6-dideoxy-N-acetyl-beta-L-altrosamine transaminase n=1 Tax=Helicobacter bizzozeronii TaxID=56877 RepID=UPI000CF01F29|nr:UDP-4-amino-4,6-dideoxy-N-acetyl-beta-L-altrosamine transaminase [Helicobacter bizzozeronii]
MNPYSTQSIDQEDILAVVQALKSDYLTQGPLVGQFEHALADYLGVKYVLVCPNATSALFLTYQALDLSQHIAITTPISFVATSNMLLANHATPLFCDIKDDGNMDENLLEGCYQACPHKERIKAVVSVDFGGKSVEARAIADFCRAYDLFFISDSSHALGGSYHHQKIGSLADVSIFSLHAIKPITTAEGGVIATNDRALYAKLQLLANHGVQKNGFDVEVASLGYNFRMNELQAALGLSQLKKIDAFLAVREKIACFYDDFFKDNPYFSCVHASLPAYIQSTNHLYSILLKPFLWAHKEAILQALLEAQIGVQVHYKPIHTFKLYQNLGTPPLLKAENFYQAQISLPCHQKMSLALAQHTAQTLLDILGGF